MRGMPGRGRDRVGIIAFGDRGGHGLAWSGSVMLGGQGMAWRGVARLGTVGCGPACQGWARRGRDT